MSGRWEVALAMTLLPISLLVIIEKQLEMNNIFYDFRLYTFMIFIFFSNRTRSPASGEFPPLLCRFFESDFE